MAQYTYDGKNWRDQSGRVTTGPLAAQLNDRARASQAGIDYEKLSKNSQYQDRFKRYGSGFAYDGPRGTLGAIAQGAIGDPANAIAQGIHHAASAVGLEDPNNTKYQDEVIRGRGEDLQKHPFARLLGNIATPLPFSKAKAVTTIGRLAEGAKAGAVGAAAMPYEGDGDYLAGKASQASLGALFGAPVNAALGKVVDRGVSAQAPSMADVRMSAGKRQGIDLGYSQLTDSGPTRMYADIASRLPGGSALRRQAKKTVDKFDQRVQDVTQATGRTMERSDLGDSIEKAFGKQGFTGRFEEAADENFSKVTREVPHTTQVDLSGTRKAMIDTLEAFPSNPALGRELANSKLVSFADKLTDDAGSTKPLFFNEAQRLRSEIGKMLGRPPLQNDIPRRELAQVYGALTDDLRKSLTDHPDALKAFNRATKHYMAGMNRIHSYIEPVVTLGTNEKMADKVIDMVKNNAKGIAALRRSATDGEWDNVAASIFHDLGKVNPGEQGATGAGLSIPKFLTDFNKLRSNPKAFNFAFGGTRYSKLRDAYGDLSEIADSIKHSVKMSNPSGSAYTAGAGALAVSVFTNPMLTAKLVGGNFALAHALAHPVFAKWLVSLGRYTRSAAQTNGKAAELALKAHIARLPSMAAAHSDISDAFTGLYSYFINGAPPEPPKDK